MPNYDQPNQNRDGMRSALVSLPEDLWPNRRALACIVRRPRVRCNALGQVLLSGTTPLVAGVSLFKDWELKDHRMDEIHGEWVYGGSRNAPAPGEDDIFTWNPPVSAAAMQTAVKDEYVTAEHYWHPVLHDANLVLQERSTGGGSTAPFPVVRRFFHNGRQLHTIFRRRVYVSNNPWPRTKLEADQPLPTPVNIDSYGIEVDLGECLHPEIEITSKDENDVEVLDLVPSVTDEKATAERALSATNHTGWQPHVHRVETREVDGLYFRIVYEALPPKEPTLSVQ